MSTATIPPPMAPATSLPAVPTRRPMTEEEFLALPDDGVERWLIDGEVREYGSSIRDFFYSHAIARVGRFLDNWLDAQPEPRGAIIGGEAGVRLAGGRLVGVDVAYVAAGLKVSDTSERTIVDGVPTLIVEILSPSDTNEKVTEKLRTYASAKVPIVWRLDPGDKTVTVYQHGKPPVLFNETQELTAEPQLPGFRVRVADLFGR